jgi:hypothetical protein
MTKFIIIAALAFAAAGFTEVAAIEHLDHCVSTSCPFAP